MLGSSLPFPAGFSSTSFSLMISRVISTFLYTHTERYSQYTKLTQITAECLILASDELDPAPALLTPRTFLSSCSMKQGHQPLTDCWANSEVDRSDLGCTPCFPSIISREHFAGILAGGTRFRRSSSTVPVMSLQHFQHRPGLNFNYMEKKTSKRSHLGNRLMRTYRCPILEQSTSGGYGTRFCQDSRSAPKDRTLSINSNQTHYNN